MLFIFNESVLKLSALHRISRNTEHFIFLMECKGCVPEIPFIMASPVYIPRNHLHKMHFIIVSQPAASWSSE
jgi:hypothetical protein